MRNRIILSVMFLGVTCMGASAQTAYDVAPIFVEELNGTARYVGMGGAMGAFGNDLSVISRNPAGTGTYAGSDANISLSFKGSNTSMRNSGSVSAGSGSINYGSEGNHNGLDLYTDNVAFVVAIPSFGTSLSSMSFAFSYHKLNNTNRTLTYSDDYYEEGKPVEFRDLENRQKIKVDAYDFNVSFNHQDRFYWGMTLERQNVSSRTEGHFYHYWPKQDGYSKATDITSVDRASDIRGYGVNFKTGIIVRPDAGPLRMGLSLSTPTLYRLNHIYEDKVYAIDGETINKPLEESIDYNLNSPWVFNASVGYSTDNTAVGLEYDCNVMGNSYIDCGGYRMDLNRDLRTYSAIRFGIETNISKVSLRWGYNCAFPMFRTDSRKDYSNTDFNYYRMDPDFENIRYRHTATVGVGYCSAPGDFGGQMYVDAAFVYNWQMSNIYLGEYSSDPVSNYMTTYGKFVLTFGLSY